MRRYIRGGLEMLHAPSRISRRRSPRCTVRRGRRFNPGYALFVAPMTIEFVAPVSIEFDYAIR